ncbi:hypothetical protein SEA_PHILLYPHILLY_21 [Microbacterium phage PhillyPhilly]|nr:hypothetical protein SEA_PHILLYPHILLY_21 [Microbacterium phage PhillyPhilly]
MSVIEFKNARGQVRYQPALPDGRRLYSGGEWMLPADVDAWAYQPSLYRSKRRASRRVSWLIAEEFNAAQNQFKAVAK